MTIDPVELVATAREEARRRQDPQADVCFLVTVGAGGRPEARPVSLRDVDGDGFGLLLNERSLKWRQIETAGQCSLTILWSSVGRQYRVYGELRSMRAERLRFWWDRKGLGSRLLEHYYDAYAAQSEPVASREAFLAGIAELGRRYPDAASVPPPPGLRGVCLWPTAIDVWHSSPADRLHDRRLFTRSGDGWTFETLVP
ncbi:MAG TPA: pyridoxamine 5'-phosphate oxidase family protein [Candidatus Bathyarchaeia archaeon]|nr:pyridoxamine 5'-phosphate oxidase family protein [Candidatus Bathyarchaeia archaeon]